MAPHEIYLLSGDADRHRREEEVGATVVVAVDLTVVS